MYKPETLHRFWFDDLKKADAAESAQIYLKERLGLWFFRDAAQDKAVRDNYLPWLKQYDEKTLEGWKDSKEGILSLILLLDQIPRNAFRDDKRAFAYDQDSLALALEALEEDYHPLEKLFLFLPIQHAETTEMQELSMTLFNELFETSPSHLKKFFGICLEKAYRHKVVIDVFGRYPHRNAVLQRPSTPKEIEFLKSPENHF